MNVYDRWHKSHPRQGEASRKEHSRGTTLLYPTADHGKGDRWQVRWRDENGKQCKRNFARRDGANPEYHAAAFDAKVKTELDTGTSLNLHAGRMKVRDYAAKYRRDLLHRDSTAERLDRVFRLHIDPLPLGGLAMAQVRPSHVRAWVKNRAHLFTTIMGRPIHRATWAEIWAPSACKIGIPRHTGLHCLRHYFATLLIHNGASVKRVQLALGHSTPMITLNTYVGEWPDTDEQTRSIVDSALGNVPGCALAAPAHGERPGRSRA